ncbi:MAG TPA: archease [Thermoplasmatales archaeon]|nr:archease [Thermoplasmatales archaeon]HEX17634.1 archease [Thermoplasmatales archaeon]
MKDFEIIEHTADVGLRAYGKSLDECFENVAKGMFAIITDNSKIDSVGEYQIELKSESLEDLLVDWLSELLFLNSAYNLVFGEFEVKINEGDLSLKARVKGEVYDREKHGYGTEIKAVTYHMLEIKKGEIYEVQVLFDI